MGQEEYGSFGPRVDLSVGIDMTSKVEKSIETPMKKS